eukprot:GEMP01098578.1.p2 GENE.GEMP01098578.1~~GEMP01098578.1.p2  ORF type:complete len:100 (-),score=2.38 GEMP01098578.1:445-744(-)
MKMRFVRRHTYLVLKTVLQRGYTRLASPRMSDIRVWASASIRTRHRPQPMRPAYQHTPMSNYVSSAAYDPICTNQGTLVSRELRLCLVESRNSPLGLSR